MLEPVAVFVPWCTSLRMELRHQESTICLGQPWYGLGLPCCLDGGGLLYALVSAKSIDCCSYWSGLRPQLPHGEVCLWPCIGGWISSSFHETMSYEWFLESEIWPQQIFRFASASWSVSESLLDRIEPNWTVVLEFGQYLILRILQFEPSQSTINSWAKRVSLPLGIKEDSCFTTLPHE